jgi:hypothetical protein
VTACRLCTNNPRPSKYGEPIKYSVRHYAHAECGLKELGAAFFDRLALWQLQNFPYFAAKQFGLAAELTRRLNEAEERSL